LTAERHAFNGIIIGTIIITPSLPRVVILHPPITPLPKLPKKDTNVTAIAHPSINKAEATTIANAISNTNHRHHHPTFKGDDILPPPADFQGWW